MPPYTPLPEPWPPAVATRAINSLSAHPGMRFVMKSHALKRKDLRGLTTSDVLYVLKYGFVFKEHQSSSREGFYKYLIEGRSPNTGTRSIRVCLIPDEKNLGVKVLTVMWVDGT